MIERKSVVDQVELNRNGGTGVRIGLLLVEDGNQLDCKWHRTYIPSDIDPALQMGAVNEHLQMMGMALVSDEDIARVISFHGQNATPPIG